MKRRPGSSSSLVGTQIAAALGVEEGNLQMTGEQPFGYVPRLHEEGTNIRSPLEHAPGDERW
jgi:hypothetical protein